MVALGPISLIVKGFPHARVGEDVRRHKRGIHGWDSDTAQFLTEVGHPLRGSVMRLTEATEENRQVKVNIRNYPFFMPLHHLEDHPGVLWARRDGQRWNSRSNMMVPGSRVTAMWMGDPPSMIALPGMRPCRVERFIGKPAFCGKCQRWGHREWQCNSYVRCGFCSGRHDTKLCKDRIINGESITPRCPIASWSIMLGV
ncbi:hypothetical protein GWK47_020254 [Chionoecetes opilio]|uniref:Gag-like protein n=1 Tax=Chionoecetes opilio TaxID=41210 RepID=A0A8J4XQ25_CHIOP|nr:hypothetical protein GWK47_020254 [Chionoecetes opilio]